MISVETRNVLVKKKEKEVNIFWDSVFVRMECLGHLFWGYAKPSEERNEYRYYNGVDYPR